MIPKLMFSIKVSNNYDYGLKPIQVTIMFGRLGIQMHLMRI